MSTETSSMYNKFKKLKLAIKRSKNSSKNELMVRDTRKSSRMSRTVVDGNVDVVPSMKRKRIYAVQGMDEERTRRGSSSSSRDRNDSFNKGSNRFIRENVKSSKWKHSFKGDSSVDSKNESTADKFSKSQRTMWAPNKKGNVGLQSKQPYGKGRETAGNAIASEGKLKAKGRMVDRRGGFVEVDSGHNFSRKKFAESNLDSSSKRFTQSRSKSSNVDRRECVEVDSGHKFSRKEFAGSNSDSSKLFSQSRSKSSNVDRREHVEVDSGHNFSRNKFAEGNLDSSKRFRQSRSKSSNVSHLKTWKKTAQDKKILDDDSSLTDDQPRKRKRIRLDPHDTSNKRLQDGVVINERIKVKKEDLEKDDKLSMNAQFRAIHPSPSILSFVEDNLLGRRRMIELRRAGYNIELSAPLDNIPSTSSERGRIEENIFRNKLTFFAAAKVSSSFPPPELPEIAFAGRSNVGKSSLLNALTRQWGVVRTSDKPGLTQTINFFKLGSKDCLVDLPGYGFAYAKEEVKDAWEELVKEYVSTRIGLRQVCLLIDTKWGMKPRDRELIDLMERFETKYQIVLTKTDTVFPIDVARRAMQIQESLKANKSVVQPVMMVSSKSGAGIQCLRTVLAKVARFAKL